MLKDVANQVNQLRQIRPDYKIFRIMVMQGRYVHDIGEFNIADAFIKSGNFASHVRNFLNRSKDLHVSYEVSGVEERRYRTGD